MVREESLRSYLLNNYIYDCGNLVRKVTYKQWIAGQVVGVVGKRGYKTLSVLGKRYYVHRLIFLLLYGFMPEVVDHKDGDKTNNMIENLRESSKVHNALNLHKAHSDNKIGVLGVFLRKDNGKYNAKFRGKSLGCFTNVNDAEGAYKLAKLRANEGLT